MKRKSRQIVGKGVRKSPRRGGHTGPVRKGKR